MCPVRKASVAGGFYPRTKPDLKAAIDQAFADSKFGPGAPLQVGKKLPGTPRKVIGGVTPHAGYTYSGSCAAITLQEICKEGLPDTVIILGNVHTGYSQISVFQEGEWETPFGSQPIDRDVATKIVEECPSVVADDKAFLGTYHVREHNIEVQIPFLQYAALIANRPIKIVPIAVGVMEISKIEQFGKELAKVVKEMSQIKDLAVLASSDMTHHEPRNPMHPSEDIKWQHQKDEAVMDAFVELDWRKTFNRARDTTVCGPQTITSLMVLAHTLGYQKAQKLKYYTSYDKMGGQGPCEYSVGYFSGVLRTQAE